MEFSTKSTLAHTELINMHACIVRITSYVATPWYVGRAVSALLTYRGERKNSVTLYTVSDCEFRNLIIFGLFP